MYEALCFIFLSGLATAAASAAHGGNYLSKTVVMGLHFICAPFTAIIFWLIFRRHKQAKAELDLIDGGPYDAVVKAYYIKPLGKLMARAMRYCAENPWPHLMPNSSGKRIQQELWGGFLLGLLISPLNLWIYYGNNT